MTSLFRCLFLTLGVVQFELPQSLQANHWVSFGAMLPEFGFDLDSRKEMCLCNVLARSWVRMIEHFLKNSWNKWVWWLVCDHKASTKAQTSRVTRYLFTRYLSPKCWGSELRAAVGFRSQLLFVLLVTFLRILQWLNHQLNHHLGKILFPTTEQASLSHVG